MNIANKITVLRIILIPFFILGLSLEGFYFKLLALLVFVIASVSDWIDGYIARKYNLVSNFGKYMDPLADKMVICSAFVCFVEAKSLNIPAWMIVIIISREFAITGIRLLAASRGKVLPAGRLGKFKTSSQMISIVIILIILVIKSINLDTHFKPYIDFIPLVLIFITTFFTSYSGYRYIIENRNLLKGN